MHVSPDGYHWSCMGASSQLWVTLDGRDSSADQVNESSGRVPMSQEAVYESTSKSSHENFENRKETYMKRGNQSAGGLRAPLYRRMN